MGFHHTMSNKQSSKKTVELSSFVESIYKNYAFYVLESRNIPDWTGLKRSQIKMLWVADKHCRKLTKTMAFTGAVVLYGGYHHAPDALSETIGKMTQGFAGSNNFPLMYGEGSFGCQTVPDGIAAPRYTEVKLHNNFDALFPSVDFNIIPHSDDPENPEPIFLAPLLPISLVNGIQGIAVGYASKIFPRNINDLIKSAEDIIKGKNKIKNIIPYYVDYLGEVNEDDNGKVTVKGKITKQRNNILYIEEVPFNYDIVSYKEFLNKLKEEKQLIEDIVEDESDSKYKIYVKVPQHVYNMTDEQLISTFDLKMNLNENITTLGIEGTVKVFDNCIDYLKYFVTNRLNLYNDRKAYLLRDNEKKILRNMIKLFIVEGLKSVKQISKKEINEHLNKQYKIVIKKYFKESLKSSIEESDYNDMCSSILDSMRLIDSLKDKAPEYESNIDSLENERTVINSKTKEDMYIEDLNNLKKYVNNRK